MPPKSTTEMDLWHKPLKISALDQVRNKQKIEIIEVKEYIIYLLLPLPKTVSITNYLE